MGSTIIRTMDANAIHEINNRFGYTKSKYMQLSRGQREVATLIHPQYVATPIGIMSFRKFREIWASERCKKDYFAPYKYGVPRLYSWLYDHGIRERVWWQKRGLDGWGRIWYRWDMENRGWDLYMDSCGNAEQDQQFMHEIVTENNISPWIGNVTDAFDTIVRLDKHYRKTKPDMRPNRGRHLLQP